MYQPSVFRCCLRFTALRRSLLGPADRALRGPGDGEGLFRGDPASGSEDQSPAQGSEGVPGQRTRLGPRGAFPLGRPPGAVALERKVRST